MNRKLFGLVSVVLLWTIAGLSLELLQAQAFIPLWDSVSAFVGDSVIFQDASGNIGIGTTTPTAKLHVAGGNMQFDNSTATAGNILKGGILFLHNFGTNNTFLGSNAGNLTMSGFNNTASAAFALGSNTTGNNNTAGGYQALYSNTGGNGNSATGVAALFNNTSGNNNTASGLSALQSNTGGSGNSATGVAALYSNTTGNNNTASGVGALQNNTTASANTATGVAALFSNTTGINNTASGANALLGNTTGSANTASGLSALSSNTTGNLNTASGVNALALNTTGFENTAVGVSALYSNTTGNSNTAVGGGALELNTTGFHNTAVGDGADVSAGDLSNATAIGFNAVVNASNKVRIGDQFVTVIEGQVGFTSSSDANKKENFQAIDGEAVLKKIRGLSLTSWNFIGQDAKEFRHYGPTAQEFFAAFGHDSFGTIGTPVTITTTDIDGILMIAAQALEQRTTEIRQGKERLKETVEALKAENADLKARLEALEWKMSPYADR